MNIPFNNMVLISYKTGYCGSLISGLLGLSEQVQKLNKYEKLTFLGSEVWSSGNWLPKIHNYELTFDITEEKWNNSVYANEDFLQALQDPRLILVKVHPNTVYKLSFIKNMKVVYITSDNKYKFERRGYFKTLQTEGNNWYKKDLSRILGANKTAKIDNRIKRKLIINNINHDVKSYEDCVKVLDIKPFLLHIDQFLQPNYALYKILCEYLTIAPLKQQDFENYIYEYNALQWKRF